jgi:hypothetical protein
MDIIETFTNTDTKPTHIGPNNKGRAFTMNTSILQTNDKTKRTKRA